MSYYVADFTRVSSAVCVVCGYIGHVEHFTVCRECGEFTCDKCASDIEKIEMSDHKYGPFVLVDCPYCRKISEEKKLKEDLFVFLSYNFEDEIIDDESKKLLDRMMKIW